MNSILSQLIVDYGLLPGGVPTKVSSRVNININPGFQSVAILHFFAFIEKLLTKWKIDVVSIVIILSKIYYMVFTKIYLNSGKSFEYRLVEQF